MTGMGRMLVVLSLIAMGQVSFAVRVELSGSQNQATLETRLSPSRVSGVSSVDLDLTIPALEIERDASGFDAVSVKKLQPSLEVGSPEVLGTGVLLVVPPGHEPSLETVQVVEKDIAGIRVRPVQQKWRCGGPKGTFAFNSALYASSSVYPQSWAQLEEVGQMAGLRLVRVAVQPVRMDLGNQNLKVANRLQLRVNFHQVQRAVEPSQVPSSVLDMVVASTANGKSLATRWLRASNQAERMLILTADEYKSALAPYIAWKTKRGLQIDVVTLTEAGGNKEELQKYIKTAYEKAAHKPTYLLFVGNKTNLPAFKESTASGSAASDYRMTLLSGEDDIPDVFYGRFLADNVAELQTQIQRTIEYEKNSAPQAWRRKGMTIASDEGSDPSDEEYAVQVQEALKTGTYNEMDSFFQGEMTAKAENILEALKAGRSWIAYFGHGSGTAWGSVNDTFSVSEVAKVENYGKLPVLIDVACQNASWMNISRCFGKAWMTENKESGPVGTVAYYGGSVNISWHPPAVMSVGIAKRHFENSVRTIGSSVMAGQLYLVEQMGTGSKVIDNLKWYNLFGDPSLEVKSE